MLIHQNLLKKVDLASWSSEFDKLDISKLESTQVDLKKLCDAVDKEVVKKDMYDESVKKGNAIKLTLLWFS